MAGATRPVQGGAYSSPRSEPGGQNTPRAGRVVASYGAYTTALGLFAQQVDQGLIYDDTADPAAIVTADGTGSDDYQPTYTDTAAGTVTAAGTGTDSYTGPVIYTDTGTATATAAGTGTEKRVYNDDATYYDNALDLDNPVSHWKLGDPSTATDRKGVRDLPAISGPIGTTAGVIANNGNDRANSFVGSGTTRFDADPATGRGLPYDTDTWSLEAWANCSSFATQGYVIYRGSTADQSLYTGTSGRWVLESKAIGGTVSQAFPAPSTLVLGQTYHLVGTYNGTDLILYINGVEAARAAMASQRHDTQFAPNISTSRGGSGFNGTIDEAAWYPTALSAARVLAHYQAGTIPAGVPAPGTGTITLTGTGTELYVPPATDYTDTAAGTVTATGTATEAAAYADTGTGTVTATGTGSDSWTTGTTYTDSQSGAITSSGSGTETAAAADTGTATATSSGTGTDSQVRSSSASGTTTASGTGTETAATADAQSGSITTTGTGTDTWIRGYLDAGTGTTTVSGTSTENYATDDTATGTLTATGSGLETHADTGTGTATTTTSGSSLETHAHADSATGSLTLTGTGSDDYQLGATTYTDTAAGTTTLTGTSLEAHTSSDSTAGQVTATGTGLETYLPGPTVHTDTATGSVTSTGTSVEAYTYTDSSAGLLTLTATSTESHGYTDSSTGESTLTGSGLELLVYTDSTLGLLHLTGTGVESTLPRQLAISTITLNQPTYNIAIQNGNMATTLTAAAAPTIRIIATPSITTSIKPPAPIAVELERIT